MMDELLEGIDKGFSKHNMKFDGLVEIPENYHNSYDYLNEYFKDNKHQLVITVRDSQPWQYLMPVQKMESVFPKKLIWYVLWTLDIPIWFVQEFHHSLFRHMIWVH